MVFFFRLMCLETSYFAKLPPCVGQPELAAIRFSFDIFTMAPSSAHELSILSDSEHFRMRVVEIKGFDRRKSMIRAA